MDAAIALVLYVVLTVGITSAAEADHRHGAAIGALLNTAIVGPLVLRRAAPGRSLAAALAASLIATLAFGPTGAEAAVLVALATFATREPDARRLGAAVVAVATGFALAIVVADADGVAGTLLAGAAGITAAVAVGAAARARAAQRLAEADRAVRLERDRRREAELAVVAERTRIARELHDVVAHNVSVMVALADGAQQVVGTDAAQAEQAMGDVAAVGREALTELRGLLGVLRDPEAAGAAREPQPGVDDIGDLVDRLRSAGLPTELHAVGIPPNPGPIAQMTLYRIVQEALTNTLRHSRHATKAVVVLRWEADAVEVEIVDDGTTASDGRSVAPGRGLTGMRERAGLHGADLKAGPAPDGGWRVAVRLPLRDDPAVRT